MSYLEKGKNGNMENIREEEEQQIDLRELLFELKKRFLVILASLLIGAVAAGAYTEIMVTPMYTSTSILLVLSKETTLTSMADLQLGSQLTGDYSVLLKSRPVLEEVIQNLGLNMRYGALRGAVSINNPESTRILEVTVTNPDPEIAKKIVDELANTGSAYIAEKMEVIAPRIIEDGEVAAAPVSPNLRKNVMLGGIAGAVLAAGVIVVMTLLNDAIKSEEDIEKYLGIPMLASVPDRKDYVTMPGGKKKRAKSKKRRRRNNK